MTRILVVNDYPAILQTLEFCLPRYGYEVAVATSAAAALEIVGRQSPQLVIVDLDMPRMEGMTLCEKMKADPQLGHLPVVMLTSNLTAKNRERATEAGAAAVLVKPFEWQLLLDTIACHVAKPGSPRGGPNHSRCAGP